MVKVDGGFSSILMLDPDAGQRCDALRRYDLFFMHAWAMVWNFLVGLALAHALDGLGYSSKIG